MEKPFLSYKMLVGQQMIGSHPGNDTRAIPPTGIKGPNGGSSIRYVDLRTRSWLRSIEIFSLFIADYIRQLGFDVTARPTGFSVIVDIVFDPAACEDWNF